MGRFSRIIILLLLMGVGAGQIKQTPGNPLLKSALLPGWGELSLGEKGRAKTFFILEGSLWISFLGAITISEIQKNNYIAFASEHAGVNTQGKGHQYWVDIGNFSSLESFNAEYLRNRNIEGLYPSQSTWDWTWDSEDNRTRFEELRIKSDLWKHGGSFLLGGIIINHIISTVDALYLKRIHKGKTLTLYPELKGSSAYIGYNLTLSF